MLISAARAATLKLANQREAAEPHAPVLIRGAEPFDLAAARALADPALDLALPAQGTVQGRARSTGPRRPRPRSSWRGIAGILPGLPRRSRARRRGAAVRARRPRRAGPIPRALTIATRARLPVAASEECEIVAFRSADDLREHVALVFGAAALRPRRRWCGCIPNA